MDSYCLMRPFQRTPANILMNFIDLLSETIQSSCWTLLPLIVYEYLVFTQLAPKATRHTHVLIECIMVIHGHPRSLISVPMESAYATSYYWWIATFVLSYIDSEIRRVIGRKSLIFSIPFSLFWCSCSGWNIFEFLVDPYTSESSLWAVRPCSGDAVIITCVVLTQYKRVTDRQTSRL